MVEPGLEVICGSMFSGKTKELIQRMRLAEEAGERVVCFKPAIDTRSPGDTIETHCGTMSYPCVEVCNPWMIVSHVVSRGATVVGVDEVQFLQGNHYSFIDAVRRLIDNMGKKVIVAGLDMDWKGNPFGPIGDLLACADNIAKLRASCPCGNKATMTLRDARFGLGQVVIGGDRIYSPRCRTCWTEEMRKRPGFSQTENNRWPQ